MNRYVEYLVSPSDWAAIESEEGDETNWDAYLAETYFTADIFPDVEEDPEGWALAIIDAQPGVWVAELCRIKHDRPSDNLNIARCGLCPEYANNRKRARARALGPTLPGFDLLGGQYQLSKPCSAKALTWLRKLTYRLEKAGFLFRRREKIPDLRQARGWDWGTRLYPRRYL